MLKQGDEIPQFELPLDDGTCLSPASLRGAIAVIYFYPKDDTSGCTREAIDFSALAADFAMIGVRVIGVSPDSIGKHLRFREKHKLTVALAADESRTAIEAFGVWQEKKLYGRSYMGVVRSTFLIDAAGLVARVWPKVSVNGHAADVLTAARELASKD